MKNKKMIIIIIAVILVIVTIVTITRITSKKEDKTKTTFENGKAISEVVLEDIEFKDITKIYDGGVTTIKADVYNNTNSIKDINVEIILKDENGNKVKSMIQAIEGIEPERKKILQTGITGDYTNIKNVEFNVLSDLEIQQYN